METIIIAIISMVGTVIIGILQYRNWKGQATLAESEGISKLVDSALAISKQEMLTVREINSTLIDENKRLKEARIIADARIESLELQVADLRNQLRELQNKRETWHGEDKQVI